MDIDSCPKVWYASGRDREWTERECRTFDTYIIMARTGSKNHTHKYHKVPNGSGKHWACALPDCTHFMPKNMNDGNIEGKKSVCWNCGTDFIVDTVSLQEDKPRCIYCRSGIKPADLEDFLAHTGTN